MKVEGLLNQLILCLSHSFFKRKYIYLAALGLNCSMWDLVPNQVLNMGLCIGSVMS